jgi:hypothetical protein
MRRAVWLLVAAAVLAGSGCGAVAVHQGGASDTRTSSPSAPAASLAASPQGSPVPCATPPNRVLSGMAYMSNLGEAVLFGGQGILGNSWVLADTWTWRPGCWTQRHPAHSPPAYRSASMAFDETAGRVIAYLGDGDPGQEQATWSWDGSDWTRVADGPTTFWAGAPDSAIAYDASIGRVVLYGLVAQAGANCWVASTQCSPQTWTWNGTTWQTMNPRHSPPPRLYSNMAYDPTTGRVLLFGGHSIPDTPNHYLGDTWGWTVRIGRNCRRRTFRRRGRAQHWSHMRPGLAYSWSAARKKASSLTRGRGTATTGRRYLLRVLAKEPLQLTSAQRSFSLAEPSAPARIRLPGMGRLGAALEPIRMAFLGVVNRRVDLRHDLSRIHTHCTCGHRRDKH